MRVHKLREPSLDYGTHKGRRVELTTRTGDGEPVAELRYERPSQRPHPTCTWRIRWLGPMLGQPHGWAGTQTEALDLIEAELLRRVRRP